MDVVVRRAVAAVEPLHEVESKVLFAGIRVCGKIQRRVKIRGIQRIGRQQVNVRINPPADVVRNVGDVGLYHRTPAVLHRRHLR